MLTRCTFNFFGHTYMIHLCVQASLISLFSVGLLDTDVICVLGIRLETRGRQNRPTGKNYIPEKKKSSTQGLLCQLVRDGMRLRYYIEVLIC